MAPKKAAAIIAGGVILVALIVGFWPIGVDQGYVSDGSRDVSCGSAFTGLDDGVNAAEFGAALRDIYAGGTGDDGGLTGQCQDALSTQRTIALVVGGVGLAALVFLTLTGSFATVPNPHDEHPPAATA